MALNLHGGVGMDISETIKSTSLCIIYHHKQITFFHKGNNVRLGPTKY